MCRIARTQEDEKKRLELAGEWKEYKATWWRDDIHAYIDNKVFVLVRSEKDRRLLRATRITGHLRTPNEGSQKAYIVPKQKRIKHGLPTLEVTAAVAKDGIIMWHVTKGSWCGDAAAGMYKELGRALRKRWGKKRSFRVVEDGDKKGFQSGKGKAAKDDEKIESWQLPPRSPDLMPLDYSIWDRIVELALNTPAKKADTAATFAARLRRVALGLPKEYINKTLLKMSTQIEDIYQARGGQISSD